MGEQKDSQPQIPKPSDSFGGEQQVQAHINRVLREIVLDNLGRSGSSYIYALAETRTRVYGLGNFLIGFDRKWKPREIEIIFRTFKIPYNLNDLFPIFSFRGQDRDYWMTQMQARGFVPKNRTDEENLETFMYDCLCEELNGVKV